MFNKTKSAAPRPAMRDESPSAIPPLPDMPAPGAAAPPVASPRGLSTLSSDLQFAGDISGAGDLQVDGAMTGDVRVGRLVIGETGSIEGAISADHVEIRGRVVGPVSGKQVKLIATAYVDGDITAEQLSIDIGAYFQGRVLQGRREAPAPITPAAPTPHPTPAVELASQGADMKPPAI